VAGVFRCRRCGECCRGGEAGIGLTNGEARAIAGHLNLSEADFRGRYCLSSGERLVLRRGAARGRCLLWSETGCLAWDLKPRACSVWPFPQRLLTDPQGLAAVRRSCPGLDPAAGEAEVHRALSVVQIAYPAKQEGGPR
jgi:Fe-S-cluster containining protein